MSIFSKIAAAEHSAVAWIEQEVSAFDKAEPTVAKAVDSGLAYIGPLLQMILTDTGELPAAAIVGSVVTEAHTDLTAASALVTDFGPTPTAASVFTAVSNNLGTLLTDAHVTNPATVAKVQKAVSEVGLLGQAVSAAAVALTPPAAVA